MFWVLLGVILLNMVAAVKVTVLDSVLLDLFNAVGDVGIRVRSRSLVPAAAFLVGLLFQPPNDRWSADSKNPYNVLFVFALFEEFVRFREFFFAVS